MKESIQAEGMGCSQFYKRVGEKPEMAEALRKARKAKGLEILEAEAFRRALEGDVKPVYRGGKMVGEVRVYSEKMLMVLLAAHAPQKYGRRGANQAGERTPEEEAALRADLVARYREINADHLRMVKGWIAEGRLQRPEDWKADELMAEQEDGEMGRQGDTELTQEGETRRRGDAEQEGKADQEHEVGDAGAAPTEDAEMGRRGDAEMGRQEEKTDQDQEHDQEQEGEEAEMGRQGDAEKGEQEAKADLEQEHDQDQKHDQEQEQSAEWQTTNSTAGASGEIPELVDSAGRTGAERTLEALEDEAFQRVVEGMEKPIFQKGKQVGVVRQRSDRLLAFLLAAFGPAKYGRGKQKAEEPELVNPELLT